MRTLMLLTPVILLFSQMEKSVRFLLDFSSQPVRLISNVFHLMCKPAFSWTNHEALVNLTLKDEVADTSAYQENAEWQLLSAKAFLNKVKYACCPEVYLDITFKVRIQRRTIYYFNNLIIPCVMIAR